MKKEQIEAERTGRGSEDYTWSSSSRPVPHALKTPSSCFSFSVCACKRRGEFESEALRLLQRLCMHTEEPWEIESQHNQKPSFCSTCSG
eukprot:1148577-Pelagomonas_calceolata.AAC.12